VELLEFAVAWWGARPAIMSANAHVSAAEPLTTTRRVVVTRRSTAWRRLAAFRLSASRLVCGSLASPGMAQH
jgi:hypothetical protein